eukprot:Sro650_g181370.2  (226) ;mRNA; r:17465-18142
MDYNSLLQRNNDLEEILDEKEAKMGALQKQRNSLLSPLHNHNTTANNSNKRASSIKGDSDTESAESGSYQSISTAGDFDMARLKTELAQKSEKILKLQMDLDMVKEERYQLKQQNKRRSINHNHEQEEPSSSFAAQDPFSFASDPFGMMGSTSHSQRTGDDWTDVEDTDNESEFGEAPFDQQRQQFGAQQQGAFGESFFTTTSSSTSKLHASTALSTTAAEPDFW